jgi:hypothetical protein
VLDPAQHPVRDGGGSPVIGAARPLFYPAVRRICFACTKPSLTVPLPEPGRSGPGRLLRIISALHGAEHAEDHGTVPDSRSAARRWYLHQRESASDCGFSEGSRFELFRSDSLVEHASPVPGHTRGHLPGRYKPATGETRRGSHRRPALNTLDGQFKSAGRKPFSPAKGKTRRTSFCPLLYRASRRNNG